MLNQINESCIVGMDFWSGIVIRRGGGGWVMRESNISCCGWVDAF